MESYINDFPFAVALSKLPDGRIVDVNEEWVRMFGYAKNEAIGKTAYELHINSDEEGRKRILKILQKKGSVRDLELKLHIKSGKERVCLISIETVKIGGEKYILSVFRDITDLGRS